ncbi:unnamed protein product [Mytilus coruscus]|uniref:Reverse transcriptase/retrotransposon-derived protein RNase H-like domain-containing protein n=1 Tax=Mytilus coruscus TaxID=42192 RepID=A0A6J8CT92_MYTCO|nr:unnamed protein product [Mytilus coruscus]
MMSALEWELKEDTAKIKIIDRGEPQQITLVTETRNLRSQPFIQSDDQISTGKHWEEWLENKKDALIIYGGKDISRLERSTLRDEEGEDEYKVLKNKLNKYYLPKKNKHHARYLFLKMKPFRDENTVTYVMRLREKAHECEFEATCEERILEHCIQTITNQDLIKRAISKGWNLDKFVEEAGQMEDTCLQMKDMKGDHRDIGTSSANKIQSNRSSYRAQDFKENRFKQNGRNITKSNCGYCGFDHGEGKRCPAYGKQCRNCEKYNHFASVCRAEKKKQQNRAGNFRQRGRSVKKTTEDKIETESNTDISDYDEDEDYFGGTIKHIMKIRKNKTYGNPVLEKSKIKLNTLQNSLPIKGEFKTIIRNKTCGTETKFIVVKGKINSPPLISKSTLIELGMLLIRADGSFAKTNHLKITDIKKDIMVVSEQRRVNMNIPDILHEFDSVFQGIGKIRDNNNELYVKFNMKPGTVPVAQKPRPVPYYLQKMLRRNSGLNSWGNNILIGGTDIDEHNKTLREVLQRAQDFGITLNKEKCEFGHLRTSKTALNENTMAYFNPTRPIGLRCEASFNEGLSRIISTDTKRHKVHYIKSYLTDTEKRYSQTEKDTLSIKWAKNRFSIYLLGARNLRFLQLTNH